MPLVVLSNSCHASLVSSFCQCTVIENSLNKYFNGITMFKIIFDQPFTKK